MSFIAGPYTITYNALALGIVEDAPVLEFVNSAQPIVGDNLGDSVQDGVYRGGNCYIDLVMQEFDAAAAVKAFWPWSTTFGTIGVIGKLLTALASVLVFTAVAGTTATPATLTNNKAILAPGYPIRMLFGSRLRNIPIRFQLLPFTNTGTPVWFI